MTGNLMLGNGTSGGNIVQRSYSNTTPRRNIQNTSGTTVIHEYLNNGQDLVLEFFDDTGVQKSNIIYERNGNANFSGGIHTSRFLHAIDDINTEKTMNIGLNSNGNSAIQFNFTGSTEGSLFYDNSEGIAENKFKLDITSAEEGYFIWHSGNWDPDTKEDSLGTPTEDGQVLTSSTANTRVWKTPKKTFTDLDDTPTDYTGKAGQLLGVTQSEDGLEFGDAGPNQTRHYFIGNGSQTSFEIPGGYLPGNVDIYLNRVRQIVGPQANGGDIDATNGTDIIFYTVPAPDAIIEVTAYVKDSFLVLPNATETTIGGIRVRVDNATGTVYITSDGTQP
jgi:hypothetical protein